MPRFTMVVLTLPPFLRIVDDRAEHGIHTLMEIWRMPRAAAIRDETLIVILYRAWQLNHLSRIKHNLIMYMIRYVPPD